MQVSNSSLLFFHLLFDLTTGQVHTCHTYQLFQTAHNLSGVNMISANSVSSSLVPLLLISGCIILIVNINSTRKVNKSLTQDVEKVQGDLKMAMDTATNCNNQLEEKGKELADKDNQIASLNDNINNLNGEKNELNEKLKQLQDQLDQVTNEKNSVETEKNNLANELKAAKAEVAPKKEEAEAPKEEGKKEEAAPKEEKKEE